ncbi:MAG: bifunctional methylenetetrahydrofolate dehydrogenase/methenyltetrahydrofolate cyclohydrolase FolD [Myxococcota bacterium]
MPPESAAIETIVVDGLALAQEIRKELSEAVGRHKSAGRRAPCLAVVLVGDDPASASYIKGKRRACERVGMESVEHRLPASTSREELLALLDRLNADDGVDGILVQLPLPDHLDANEVAGALDPAKDVDGLHPVNAGRLLLGQGCLTACTPLGIMEILRRYDVPLEGADAVVIGRSNIVGKPVSLLLQRANATVTMCHSRTRDLAERCRRADVIVAAVGSPLLVKPDWVKPGAAVIDVGVTDVDGTLTGDVDTAGVQGIARIVTPHRRGVGPMTITMLLQNTLTAYEERSAASA